MEFAKIKSFIRKHHVMTVATVGTDGKPWVTHVFYARMPREKSEDSDSKPGYFVFMTDPETRHGTEMTECTRVAAAIALETRIVGSHCIYVFCIYLRTNSD